MSQVGAWASELGEDSTFFFLVGIRCVFVWLNMYICILCIFICLQIHYVFIFVCICKIFNYTLFCCTHVCFFSAIYTYIRISYILHGICTPSLFRICWKSLKSCSLTFSSMKIRTPWSHWWRWLDIALVCDHVLNQIVTCDFFNS